MRIDRDQLGCEIHAGVGEGLGQCSTRQVVELLRRSGYVLFRGFSPSIEEYESFTAQFGTCADTREVHYPAGGIGLGFHAEDAYNPYRPDTIWFFCVYEGSDGGVPTGVVDGIAVLNGMPPEWQSFCRTNRLRFDRQWNAATWKDATPVASRRELGAVLDAIPGIEHAFLPDDSLYVGYETPLIVRTANDRESFANTVLQASTDPEFYGMTLADGSPVPEELLALATRLAVEHERPVGWSSGDVVVIDNTRMMHRRGRYVQVDRDLRARHCEDFFGSLLPAAESPVTSWCKSLIQGDVDLPVRVGPPSGEPVERVVAGAPHSSPTGTERRARHPRPDALAERT